MTKLDKKDLDYYRQPGAVYKHTPILKGEYSKACKKSSWIKEQEDVDFVRTTIEKAWYHIINLGGYITPGKCNMDSVSDGYPMDTVRGKKVLDLGCSDGQLSVILEKHGAEVVAVDLFDHTLDHARLVKRFFDCGFNIVKGDAVGDLSFLGEFDVVFCSNLVQHVDKGHCVNDMSKELFYKNLFAIAPKLIIATNSNSDIQVLKNIELNTKIYSKYKILRQTMMVVVSEREKKI